METDQEAYLSDGYEPIPDPLETDPAWLAQLRETSPDTTEAEAWLLERLVGALGMVRMLMKHGAYMVGDRDMYEVMDDFCLKRYGWKLHWRDREPKRAHKAGQK